MNDSTKPPGRPLKYGDTKAKRMNLVIAEDVRELLQHLRGLGVLSMSEIVNSAVREWASSRGK
jgi:hypothetical protein|tara:strand:+ start:2273 stop:2461 length:189 start_codon:yes stop_codon:yes gene_type:complete